MAYRSAGPGALVVPPGTVTNPDRLTLGRNVLIHEGVSILIGDNSSGVEIGDGTVLSRYAHIASAHRVTIGHRVSTSDHVAVLDTWGPVDESAPPRPGAGVVVEDGAYLGYGCIVCPGVTIGTGAFVGEGAVVTGDVAPHTVVYGNPAVPVRHLSAGRWTGTRFP